jgi:hypothetical protein
MEALFTLTIGGYNTTMRYLSRKNNTNNNFGDSSRFLLAAAAQRESSNRACVTGALEKDRHAFQLRFDPPLFCSSHSSVKGFRLWGSRLILLFLVLRKRRSKVLKQICRDGSSCRHRFFVNQAMAALSNPICAARQLSRAKRSRA